MSSELKLLSRADVEKSFQPTEGICHLDVEIPSSTIDFHGLEENPQLQRPAIVLEGKEYELSDPGLFDVAGCLGVPRNYAAKCPNDLLLQNLKFWSGKGTTAKLRLFLKEDKVIGCAATRKPYYSSSQILEEVEKQIGVNDILGYHKVHSSLAFTDFAVVVNKSFEPQAGDILHGGIEVQNSTKGEYSLEVSPYIFRQVCTNGAVVSDSIGRWSSKNDPAEIGVWAQNSTRQALLSLDQEFNRIRKLVDVKFNGGSANTIRSLFRRFGIPDRTQKEILAETTAEYGEEGPKNMYDLYNSITKVASHSGKISPVSARQLQLSAGRMTKEFGVCPECHQVIGN